jgi:hypothetical protein
MTRVIGRAASRTQLLLLAGLVAAQAAALLGGLWTITAAAAETPHGWVLLEATVSDVERTTGGLDLTHGIIVVAYRTEAECQQDLGNLAASAPSTTRLACAQLGLPWIAGGTSK